jgi:hypothetical protein
VPYPTIGWVGPVATTATMVGGGRIRGGGACDRTTSEGVRRQDQLERFSAKREHNQHIIVHYYIIHSSKSYYNLGSCIRYIKKFEAKTTLQRLIRVCGSDFSPGQDIPFLP